jgi:hypothetical protein
MRSIPFTAAVVALSLTTAAWGQDWGHDRWNNPHGDQGGYGYPGQSGHGGYGNVAALAREIAQTADWIHNKYERNNRRPNRDEARVAVALHELEEQAIRFYEGVDGYGRGSRGSRDFENLLRAFDATSETLRYIARRPYVDQGMDRIWSLLTQMDSGYGVSGRYGRGWARDRNNGYDRYDRDDHDRYDRRDDRDRDDDRYRPPVN